MQYSECKINDSILNSEFGVLETANYAWGVQTIRCVGRSPSSGSGSAASGGGLVEVERGGEPRDRQAR